MKFRLYPLVEHFQMNVQHDVYKADDIVATIICTFFAFTKPC